MLKIELGCGNNKRIKDSIGIDLMEFPGVDYVCDLNKGMTFLDSNSVDEIYSHHFLEHLDDLPTFMEEVHRVLKPGGLFKGEVPHFSNPYFYSDPTHNSFFGLYTFNYFFRNQDEFKRKVPSFYNQLDFELVSYRLIFKNVTSNSFSSKIKVRVLNKWFNANLLRMEIFEEHYSRRFPCYELRFCIKKV